MSSLSPGWPDAPPLLIDPIEESQRISELLALKVLDTQPEHRFDRITRLAADFFRVPIAYVAFLDDQRQWLKSRIGLDDIETPRCMTFCQFTVTRAEPLIILNALEHPIGRGHPWVTGPPHVRFYAGVPLSGPTGRKIGTLCLVDFEARQFNETDTASLVAFGALVEREINLGDIIQTQNELLQTRHELIETKQALEHEMADAAKYVRGMLPPQLDTEEIIDWSFHPSMNLGGDGLGYRRVDDDRIAFYILDVTGHGLGSALLAVSALELLRNRNPASRIDFGHPAGVMERLNRTFQMKDHASKFFSAWYGVYSRSRREITYANAGHPPAVLLTNKDTKPELHQTAPGSSVLGILPQIDTSEITVPFPPTSELYLFTDGLYELLDPNGERGSYVEFLDSLRESVASGTPAWKAIQRWHEEAQQKHLLDDDVSLLRFATRE